MAVKQFSDFPQGKTERELVSRLALIVDRVTTLLLFKILRISLMPRQIEFVFHGADTNFILGGVLTRAIGANVPTCFCVHGVIFD